MDKSDFMKRYPANIYTIFGVFKLRDKISYATSYVCIVYNYGSDNKYYLDPVDGVRQDISIFIEV